MDNANRIKTRVTLKVMMFQVDNVSPHVLKNTNQFVENLEKRIQIYAF